MATKLGDILLTKQSGTTLELNTDKKYVTGNVSFGISAKSATTQADTAAADVNVVTTAGSGATNISGVIGEKASSQPSSGYFIRMEASGSGNTKVTEAGWVGTGSLQTASTAATKYFPVTAATVTQNKPTVNGSGVVTATVTTTAGYTPAAASAASNTLQLSTQGAKTVTPTESEQTAVESGKYTTGIVKVAAISSTYVGSGIAQNDASDLVVSGKNITAPAGYYAEDATASVADGAYSASVSAHSISTPPVVTGATSGTITDISTTTKPSGTDGTNYWTITPGGSVTTTGVSTAKGKATIGTAGYIVSGNKETNADTVSITPTVNNGTVRYITKATSSTSNGTATATAGTASTSVTGMVTTNTNTGYSVNAAATGGSASLTASSVTVGAGYNPSSVTASTTAKNATGENASETKYIQKGVLSASVSSNTNGSASMAATGFTPLASGTSNYYVTLSTTSGSVKAKASVGTEGYVKTETNETGATSVSVSGNNTKLYIPSTSVTQGTTTVSGQTATRGTATWSSGYLPAGNIAAATFAKSATSGTTYVDISNTTAAPVLVEGDYLYVNKGYTDNLKISLARLVPDGSDVKGHNEYLLSGHSAYDNDGTLVSGNIETMSADNISVSGPTITLPTGMYTGGTAITKTIDSGAVTTFFTGDGMSTYFNAGTSSDKNVTITPKYTNTAGYIAAHSSATNSGGTTYYKIKTATASVNGDTVSYGTGWITEGSKTVAAGSVTPAVNSHSISTTPVVTGAITGTVTDIGTTTKPSGTDGTNYWTITPGGSVTTTGKSTANAKATVSAGYIATSPANSGNSVIDITPTVNNGTVRYIVKATTSTSNGTATATAGTASTSVTGMVTTSTDTGYSVSASATGGNASVTSSSATVNAGYNPSPVTASTTAKSATGDSASQTKYIQKGVLSASVSANNSGSATMSATGFTASSSTTSYYVTLATTAGSVKAQASVGTEGYVKTETDETAATNVPVSGNGNKLYIPGGAVTTSFAGDGMSTYFDAGTSTDKNVTITPKYTNTAGYIAAHSTATNNGGTSYYKIKTTTASVSGDTVSYGTGWITSGSSTVAAGSVTQNAPTINSSTGLVTAASTVSPGYISADPEAATLQLTTKAATTFNTSTSDQTIVAGTYLTGKQTFRAVTTANIDAGNIKSGINIKVGDSASAGRIKNITGTFTSASTVTSGQTAATAAVIRTGYSAWVDAAEVKGSLPDTTIAEGTTTVSSDTATRGTWSQTAGYTAARTIAAATFAKSATSGVTYVDISNTTSAPVLVAGDYLYINKGWTDNVKISLARLVPDGSDVKGHNDYILNGHSAYDNDGTLVSGNILTMAASDISVDGPTITLPTKKYTGGTAITKTIDSGAVTTSFTGDGMSTYFDAGTSSDKNVTITPKYTNTAGYIAAHTTATNNGGTTYYKIKTANPAFSSPTPSGGSTASSSQLTINTTSTTSGVEIQTAYSVNAANFTYNAAVEGWVSKANGAAAGSTSARSSTNGTKYYVTALTLPKDKGFTVTTTADTALDTTSDLDITNNAYRRVDIDNKANGTVLVGGAGSTTFSAGSTTTGSLTVNAYNASGTAENSKAIVADGKWVATSITEGGTYYGRVTVGNATITSGSATISSASFAYDSTSAKFNVTGSATIGAPSVGTAGYISSSKGTRNTNTASLATTVNKIAGGTTITGTTTVKPIISKQDVPSGVTQAASGNATTTAPTSGVYVALKTAANTGTLTATPGVTTAGYGDATNHGIAANTATVGASASDTTYVPIITASPAFDGGGLSGTATASSSTATISDSTNNSGISFTTACTATRANVLYNGAVNGWVTKADNAQALAGGSTAMTAKTYYINGVTVASSKSFSVTGAGTTTWTPGSSTTGSLTVSGYYGSTAENNKSIISAGKWVDTSVSAAGTYYGRVTVAAGSVTASVSSNTAGSATMAATGFTASSSATSYYVTLSTSAGSVKAKAVGNAAGYITSSTSNETAATSVSVTGNGNKLYIPAGSASSDLTNSGVSISTTNNSGISVTPRHTTTAGYVAAATNVNGTTQYINGVTLSKPSSGTRTFTVTVPDGSSTLTYTFTVDSSGNVDFTGLPDARGVYF